ncbi:hypothetical protein FKM82_020388 [Ascaphus truei]
MLRGAGGTAAQTGGLGAAARLRRLLFFQLCAWPPSPPPPPPPPPSLSLPLQCEGARSLSLAEMPVWWCAQFSCAAASPHSRTHSQ